MDRYAVLVFHDQNITDDQQMEFTKNFGEIEGTFGGNITKPHELRLKTGMIDVSNLDKEARPLPRDDRRRMFNLGNRLWHSDLSFRAVPAKYSILSARKVATNGGNTEFADMRIAYDLLDDETRALVEDLVCEHTQLYSRGSMGFSGWTEEELAMFKPVRQRLVRTHRSRGASRSTCRRTPERSSAGRCRRHATCCAISTSTQRVPSSSTSTAGGCTIS